MLLTRVLFLQMCKKIFKIGLQRRANEATITTLYSFVAEVENNIVGFANFSSVREDGKVELWAIYVHPEQQGRGIGSALLQKGCK